MKSLMENGMADAQNKALGQIAEHTSHQLHLPKRRWFN
jgi:hypothetical protein